MATAFPSPRLPHFQKQGSVKEELKWSGRRVQVELSCGARDLQNDAVSGVRTGNAVTGVPRSRVRISPAPPPTSRTVDPEASCFCGHDGGDCQRTNRPRVAAFPENRRHRLGGYESGDVGLGKTRLPTERGRRAERIGCELLSSARLDGVLSYRRQVKVTSVKADVIWPVALTVTWRTSWR